MSNTPHIDVYTTRQAAEWLSVLAAIGQYDYYHLPVYHRLAETCGEGRALLLAFEEDGYRVAFPMLLREIPAAWTATGGTTWQDVTSVYGYAGPLASTPHPPAAVQAHFTEALTAFLRSEGVIAAFSRLHPLFNQANLLAECGEVVELGTTLSIDLTRPADEQWMAYRKNLRYDIRKLREKGFTCSEVGEECLDAFITLYYATMDRDHADASYYFDRAYFAYLLREMADVMHLFVCEHDGTVVCGGLFAKCRDIVQYHLSGVHTEYLKWSPTKLLLDTARVWAHEHGAHALHLGGGVGGKRDSLFTFKNGFTDREHTYAIWRHVVNQEAYTAVYQERCRLAGVQPDTGYFPSYRHPLLHEASVTV